MEKNDFSLSLSMIHAWIEQLPLIQQQELCRFIEQKIAEKQTNSDKENQAQTVEKGDAQNNFAILLHLFYKISEQTQETHLREFSKELRKIYPTENSLVTIISDYDEEENSVGLSIYVASPALLKDVEKTDFYAFFAASLTLVEPAKL
jgi:hypothetical protein